jgi:hypothetical protein
MLINFSLQKNVPLCGCQLKSAPKLLFSTAILGVSKSQDGNKNSPEEYQAHGKPSSLAEVL